MTTVPFVFRAADPGSIGSARLAAVVGARTFEHDPRALTARMLLLPPFRDGETPYRSISAFRARPPVPEIDETTPRSVMEAALELRRALERAVEAALHGVRRAAVLTGGGLDSSVLLALAVAHAQRTGGSAFGVALDFGGPGDDRPHLRALEADLGCEILRVRPEDAAHRFGLLASGVDATPLTWPGGPLEIEMMVRARDHGAECALTGAGADALFDGEPRSLADLVRRGDVRTAIASARELRGFDSPSSPLLTWLVRPIVAEQIPLSLRAWRAHRQPVALPSWAGPRAAAFVREWRHAQLDDALTKRPSARTRLEARLRAPHLDHLAWLRHQEEVGSGLERRDPYLDPTLTATITRLPQVLLLHGNIRRGLFREAVRGLVPESLRTRLDKAAFEPAFARFVAASGGLGVLRPRASVPRLAALGLAEPARFREAFEAFAASVDDPSCEGWSNVWPALAVESFLGSRAG